MHTSYTHGHVCRYACMHVCIYTERKRERQRHGERETDRECMSLIRTAPPIGSKLNGFKIIFKNRHTTVKTNIQLGEGILFCQNQSSGILITLGLDEFRFLWRSCYKADQRWVKDSIYCAYLGLQRPPGMEPVHSFPP